MATHTHTLAGRLLQTRHVAPPTQLVGGSSPSQTKRAPNANHTQSEHTPVACSCVCACVRVASTGATGTTLHSVCVCVSIYPCLLHSLYLARTTARRATDWLPLASQPKGPPKLDTQGALKAQLIMPARPLEPLLQASSSFERKMKP